MRASTKTATRSQMPRLCPDRTSALPQLIEGGHVTIHRKPGPTDPDVSRRGFLSTVAVGASAMLLSPADRHRTFGVARNQHVPSPSATGYVAAHDGTPIYYEVHGTGERVLLLGPYTAPLSDPAR